MRVNLSLTLVDLKLVLLDDLLSTNIFITHSGLENQKQRRTKGKHFFKRLLIASINSPVLAVKFSDPFYLPFFYVKCIFCLHFLQDGNREISDGGVS